MRPSTIAYWVATGLFGAGMFMSSLLYLSGGEPIRTGVVDEMGYPAYFLPILGTWKLLGAIALLTPPSVPIPGLARIKDWAYAGFFFNLTAALASHLVLGHGADHIVPVLFFSAVYATSFALRPASVQVAQPRLVTA
jgi:hypothetical protein